MLFRFIKLLICLFLKYLKSENEQKELMLLIWIASLVDSMYDSIQLVPKNEVDVLLQVLLSKQLCRVECDDQYKQMLVRET